MGRGLFQSGVLLVALATLNAMAAEPQSPWVPYIDACMAAGNPRPECIAALPLEVLAQLEAWEARNGAMRRAQMATRNALQPGSPVFGQTTRQVPHQAVLRLQPSRLVVALPATQTEAFLLQLFEILDHDGAVGRHMRGASELQGPAATGAAIAMDKPYDDPYFLHGQDLRDRIYVRLIRVRSLTYRDYKPTVFDFQPDGELHIDGYVQDQETFASHVTSEFKPISRSAPFTIRIVREQDPDFPTEQDYSQNLGYIEGLPLSATHRLPLDTPFGWHYEVPGIYFTAAGRERYSLRQYVANPAGKPVPIGFRGLTIDELEAHAFRIEDVSYAGD